MELIVTKNANIFNNGIDSDEKLFKALYTRKKYQFIYDGIKFISDKEIIGVEPGTYKLIYKKDN